VASCLFCSFARLKPGDAGAYTMTLEEVWDKLRTRAHQPLTEIHVVNGLHPDLPFDYYTELLRGFKRIRPDIHLKCFTAVEIAFFADRTGRARAGAARADGGGPRFAAWGRRGDLLAARAEEDCQRREQVRRRSLPAIHRLAHRLGMRTNVTMLYGHIETAEERVDHMIRARALQDDTGGFQAFIPLAFHPDNTRCASCRPRARPIRWRPRGRAADVRQHRPRQGVLDRDRDDVAQTAPVVRRRTTRRTVQEGRIYHMAGSPTPTAMTTRQIERLILAAGREPIEGDTLYNVVARRAERSLE